MSNILKRLFIININILISILVILNFTLPIHAQADYMAPGVPFSAHCYLTNNTPIIRLELQMPNKVLKGTNFDIYLKLNNTQTSPVELSSIKINLLFDPNYLQIQSIKGTDNCQQIKDYSINNKTGQVIVNLNANNCKILSNLPMGTNNLFILKSIAKNAGQGTIIIPQGKDTSNLFTLKTGTIESLDTPNTQYSINIISTTNNSSNTYVITPTPPDTGVINTKTSLLLAVLLILLAGGIKLIIHVDQKNINSKIITNVE